ncbi:MAG: GTPase Era [Pseudomonadota bacterium]
MSEPATRCGFVALLGAPNAGKSTLLNSLIGAKVAIVTPKVQTTRSRLRAIAIADQTQIVFVDTPGIFAPKRRLERAMVASAWGEAAEADRLVLVVDAALRQPDRDTARILDGLAEQGRRATLVLNKVDKIKRARLLEQTQRLSEAGDFDEVFMISALTGDGVQDLLESLVAAMPEGPWLYPEDQLLDISERLFAAEVTREKLFLRLHDELPYALTVETESWETRKDGSVRIEQTVYLRRDSQKAIALGHGGRTIKAVREAAQEELAAHLGCPVHLFLFVKVRERWQDDPARYRTWGLDFEA